MDGSLPEGPPGLRADQRRSLAIGVVGAGRLGGALAAALAASGYTRVSVAVRRPAPLQAPAGALPIAAAEAPELVQRCALVFLTVPDGAITRVAEALPWRAGQAAVHCSGALGLEALAAAVARGAAAGCLHPLQTFPADLLATEAAGLFAQVVCGVEGAEPLGGLLEAIAADLGARSVRLEGVDRALYHAAAVLASNDVVALAAAANRAWALAGLPAGEGMPALAPLLLAAARNVGRLPLAQALTGPLARGDVGTVERQLRALAAEPYLRELYRRLALELLRLDVGHAPAVAAALRRALADEPAADAGAAAGVR